MFLLDVDFDGAWVLSHTFYELLFRQEFGGSMTSIGSGFEQMLVQYRRVQYVLSVGSLGGCEAHDDMEVFFFLLWGQTVIYIDE